VVVHHRKNLYFLCSATVVVNPVSRHLLVAFLLTLLTITENKVETTALALIGALEPSKIQIFASI